MKGQAPCSFLSICPHLDGNSSISILTIQLALYNEDNADDDKKDSEECWERGIDEGGRGFCRNCPSFHPK